ncbi:SIMPL domain-containing protein [Lysobacter sp. HA18]
MRRMFATLALLFAATVAQAQVNALPPTRHILVYGDAQARAIPDRYRISVNFTALDMDAGAARKRVEDALTATVARLRKADVAEREIVATSLSINPEQRYDDKLRTSVFAGTRVRRSLNARFNDKSALENFLSGLQTSDELSVSDIRTELSDEPKLREALRMRAIEATREKASTIAKSYGARLGGVYSVSDVAPQFEYGIHEGNWPSLYEWNSTSQSLDRVEVTGSRIASPASPAPGATSLQTGYVTYTDRIYAVFLLAD